MDAEQLLAENAKLRNWLKVIVSTQCGGRVTIEADDLADADRLRLDVQDIGPDVVLWTQS